MYSEAPASVGLGQPYDHFKEQDLKSTLPPEGKPVRKREKDRYLLPT